MKRIIRKIGNGIYKGLSWIFSGICSVSWWIFKGFCSVLWGIMRGIDFVYYHLPRPVRVVVRETTRLVLEVLVYGVFVPLGVVLVGVGVILLFVIAIVFRIIENICYEIKILWRRIIYRNDSELLAAAAYEDYLDEMERELEEEEREPGGTVGLDW